MVKVALLVWIVLGTTLAGVAVTVVLTVPGLMEHAMKYIPMAGIGGFIVAIPFSFMIAKQLTAALKR